MRALRFHAFGPPDVLRVDEVPSPTPAAGEALIEVSHAGLNFADTERRRGLYLADAPLPVTTGFEGAGVVRAVGVGVEQALVGRRVSFLSEGSLAELCVARTDRLIELPNDVTFAQAAAFPVQGLTAWHVLNTVGRLQAGETVCVTAAAGGVGQLAVQLARARGATVIGLVSSEAKRGVALARGAHDVLVGAEAEGLRDRVDVFLDSVGRDVAHLVPVALRPFGRWVHFGNASGPTPGVEPERLLEKSLTVSGWWLRTPHPASVWRSGVDAVLGALVAGSLTLEPQVIALADVPDAHRALEARTSTGKFVAQL